MKVYLPFRELLLNLEAAGLHRVNPLNLSMTGRELEYYHTVKRSRPTCTICNASDVTFVPFTNPGFPTLRVVRVCQVCNHAEEL